MAVIDLDNGWVIDPSPVTRTGDNGHYWAVPVWGSRASYDAANPPNRRPVIGVTEISKVVGVPGRYYIEVAAWLTLAAFNAGNPPRVTNDFLMDLRKTETRIVRRAADGFWQRQDGTFVAPGTAENPDNPFARETVNVNVRRAILQNVVRWIERAVARADQGDTRLPARHRLVRTDQDADGILADVAGLRDGDG